MLRIRKLTLKNIGPFEYEELDFSINPGNPDIHIIVGPNGTGKTTILHSLASTFDYFEPDHKEHVSNNVHKRFKKKNGKFLEDEKAMADSYSHVIITDKSGKVIDKLINYGCKKCGNIHQNFEKTISHSMVVSKNGNNYQKTPQSKLLLNYKNSIRSKDLINKNISFAAFGYSGYRLIESEQVEIKDNENFNPLYLALEFVKKKDGSEREFKLSNWIVSRYSKAALEEVSGNKILAEKYRHSVEILIKLINELTNYVYKIAIETNPWKVVINFCGNNLEFDVLPDGLRSILSWIGDLLMRLDAIPWEDKDKLVNEQNIIVFLDEVEVHLHPTWQYKILKMIYSLLPNSQIFITTHSPFIINSIDNAKLYLLDIDQCTSRLCKTLLSENSWSISFVLEEILNAKLQFGFEISEKINRFNLIDSQIVLGNFENEEEFKRLINELSSESLEVRSIIFPRLLRLKNAGQNYLNE